MQDLNTIPSVGTFGEVASNANTNFSLLKIAIDLLEHSIEHSRGYFTSASALTTAFPSPVVGDWAIVEVGGSPVIYKCSTRGTWSNSGTQWAGGSVDLTEYAQKAELYNSGYYICETAAATAAKTVSASGYLLKAGGNIRIKMSYANTAANATLNIGGTGAKPLYYNDARASASNSWEAEEVVVVYYDGANYIASNAMGGGGGEFSTGEKVKNVGIEQSISGGSNLPTSGAVYRHAPENRDGSGSTDLAFTDETGFAIAKFENGHILTKNFNSEDVSNLGSSGTDMVDFAIADDAGNIIVKLENGHIKTKKFDSSRIRSNSSVSPLFQTQNNPFGISASRFYLRAGKRAHFKDYAPLIIVAGQSNADGRIIYTDSPTWLANNNYGINNFLVWDTASRAFQTYNVMGMTGNGGATAGSDGTGENKYAFDAQFAHDWLQLYGGKLYMVRQTLGGIGIENQPTTGTRNWTWQPDIDNIVSGCNSMCVALMNKVLAAIDYAYQQGVILVPICVLWHQGENDSVEGRVNRYKQNLSNLIMWMRGLFLAPTLPFICGEVNELNSAGYAQINSIFAELAEADDYMSVVSMAGHYTTLDDVHFDASAIEYMGNQMFVEIQKYV